MKPNHDTHINDTIAVRILTTLALLCAGAGMLCLASCQRAGAGNAPPAAPAAAALTTTVVTAPAVTPAAAMPPVPAGAIGSQPGWGHEPVESRSDTRGRICLNGIWQFMPAEGDAQKEPRGAWGQIYVPGSWKKCAAPYIVNKGSGAAWDRIDDASRGWYARTLVIPPAWSGSALVLDFRRISTDADVFVNGAHCGRIAWPAGEVDITAAVGAQTNVTLLVKVIAAADEGMVANYMGHDQVTLEKAQLESKGIIGEVFLHRRPNGPQVADVFVRTSTRRKEIALDVELAGITEAGEVTLTAACIGTNGVVEKTFTRRVRVSPAALQTVTLVEPWATPRLWDFRQPNLYTLTLAARGAGMQDVAAHEFGFRECWIDGRKIFLNGSEFRLRPTCFADQWSALSVPVFDGRINGYVHAGFNIAELWPFDTDKRGVLHYRELICERASQKGFPLMGPAPSMNSYLVDAQWRLRTWREDPTNTQRFLERMRAELRRYRDYPAVIMWSSSANYFGNGNDQDPRMLSMTNCSSYNEYLCRAEAGIEGLRMMKQVDPTRPFFTHHGSYVGDMHTCNMYLDLLPLQEREEWLSAWATNGILPFCGIEFGTPLDCTLFRGRNGFGNNMQSEPLITEFCAIYQGALAYRTEADAYRQAIQQQFITGQLYKSWHGETSHLAARNFQDLQALFVRNTWRAWRTWGLTGGLVPWTDAHGWGPSEESAQYDYVGALAPGARGPYVASVKRGDLRGFALASTIRPAGRMLMDVNGPTLAWIAGASGAFTEKDHSYRPGETVQKQIVLINDQRAPQNYALTWRADLAGGCIAGGTNSGMLAVGENLFIPISVPLSISSTSSIASIPGLLSLAATIGTNLQRDSLAFRVVAPPARVPGRVQIYDPPGDTTRLLQQLGIAVQPVSAGTLLTAGPATLVIGRAALSRGNDPPAGLIDFVKHGGRLLVCAQDPQWTPFALGLRTAPHLSRRVFRIDPHHPVVAGLDDDDLRDWRGESALVPAYPDFPGFEGYPSYGWHWGNRGGVSSCPIEKPHRTSWRPILESEFDLAYTPLMEMEFGRGRVTFCTLDLEDHAASDPAAARLAAQLLDYVLTAPITPKAARVAYLGDARGARLLDDMGVVHTKFAAPGTDLQLLIVGANAKPPEATVKAITARGGHVLYLMRQGAGAQPHGLVLEQRAEFHGALDAPAWPECAGLSASDLRWRANHEAWLIMAGEAIESSADGQLGRIVSGNGSIVFCQIDPRWLPADEKTYFRFTRWRQMRALAQLLANLGASFQQDQRFMTLLQQPDHPVMLAGQWDVQLTDPQVESVKRAWNNDRGFSAAATALVQPEASPEGWEQKPVPAYMESYGPQWQWADGEAVFRKIVVLPARFKGKALELAIGRADQKDTTFFNGTQIGETDNWLEPRRYAVPANLVQGGTNVIAIRLFDAGIHGGLCDSPEKLYLRAQRAPDKFYHDDYLPDYASKEFELGDNPYRYFRW